MWWYLTPLVSFSLNACINICAWVHTHSRTPPICTAQSHYRPLLMLVSTTECRSCLCILPSAQLMQSDSLIATIISLKATGCRAGNRMQEIKRVTNSTCRSGFLQKRDLCSPIVYHLLPEDFWNDWHYNLKKEADVSEILQPCRLLAWKQTVRHKSLENRQWHIRNSVTLFNTIKSIPEWLQT